jgi:hypothetical protein
MKENFHTENCIEKQTEPKVGEKLYLLPAMEY